MKSALPLKLVVCWLALALPVTAQSQIDRPWSSDLRGPAIPPTAGPVASAITREAVRLAAAAEPTAGAGVEQNDKPAESGWARVRGLAPGTEIIVTVQGSDPSTRFIVLADGSQLTVLNVAGQMIPTAARKVLLDLASRHPAFFAADERHETFVIEQVRVGPDGVFMADRKVADLGQVVERIVRHDVSEIKAAHPPIRGKRLGSWAAFPGAFVGAMLGGGVGCAASSCRSDGSQIAAGVGVGALVGAAVSALAPRKLAAAFLGVAGGNLAGGLIGASIQGDCRPDHPCTKGVLVGAPLGAISGGLLGYRMASHRAEGTIYRAP